MITAMDPLCVSALVVSYHTGPRLKECLYALESDPEVDQIVLIDNGNTPDTRDWLARFSQTREHFQYISGHGNVGFGAGINLGAKMASGTHFLIINPDAVLRRGSVGELVSAAETAQSPTIVGGRVYSLRGLEERGARRRELTFARALTSFVGWNTWTLEKAPAPEGPVAMPVISGAFFAISKIDFETLGGFDETYFLHVEDVDICRRCRDAGGEVIYQPRAGALHYSSTSQAPSKTVAGHKADSLKHYFLKFAAGPLERVTVRFLMPLVRAALLWRAR